MKIKSLILLFAFTLSVFAFAQNEKPRILISSDIGGTDPDDNQSMLHLFMYSEMFDIEGLVSSPSFGDGSKEEILRMIDVYEKDFPVLQKHCSELKTPKELRPLCKQGRHGLAPFVGYEKATEGSDWIIECARRQDSRPLYVLVWGTLEDVAQALHDAPDIADKIRVYYIGGPNKKWGVNSYAYIAENFPNLWMIENNASYRGLISKDKDNGRYHAGYYNACMKGAGNIGADFINYYKGVVKMGDTPSLLYMMHGNPDEPEGESWGGSFEKMGWSPRRIINPTTELSDTVAVYSVVEFKFKGKKLKLPVGTPCFNLLIDKQNWQGCYLGKGEYCVRYSPKQTATLSYEITCDNGAFQPIKGTLIVENQWPGEKSPTDYKLGQTWWTDRTAASLFEGKWQGAVTVGKYRQQVLDDWAERLGWLKENSKAVFNPAFEGENRRVIVTTDIGGTDPDDEQSMVHLLMMANDIDIDGIVCQMAFCKSPIGIENLRKIIDAYAIAEPNLKAHDARFPTAEYLRSIATTGQTEVGMSGVGEGKDTPGSELIIKAIDRDDPRPIWLTAWGGMNTIAQAIWKAQHTRSEADFKKFISKIRIYDILGQCDAGAWIAHNFPEILYIRARDIYNWAPDDNWTKQNIQAFSPMGSVYPMRKWATEGDSPSFLYLVNNGLNMPENPTAGGWGGRFSAEKTEGVRGMDWVERNNLDEKQYDPYLMHTNPNGEQTMQRWSDAIRNDFAARIQWSCNAEYSAANHHPVILLNDETEPTRQPIYIEAKAGEEIRFSTKNSFDPDGNALTFKAYLYKEASGYNRDMNIKNDCGTFYFTVPSDATCKKLHIIIEATDNGKPALTRYARLIVDVK